MLKALLYIFLFFLVGVIGCGVWGYFTFAKIPSLDITKENTRAQNLKIIDDWFTELHEKGKFNGTVLLARDGKPDLINGYGYTDCTKSTKLTEHSSMRLASVSKQFTAAAVMLLQEKGLINYDDLIKSHLPTLPYSDVTIRHLLQMTSGVPNSLYMTLANKKKKEIGDVLSISKAIDLLSNYGDTISFKPNDAFEYSNTNYVLLAGLVESKSSKSFEEFMQEELFEPLGMKDTRVWNLLSKDTTFENKTSSFIEFVGACEPLLPEFLDGVAGDGGVFSSVHDLLIWDQFWKSNDLISAENLAQAFETPTLNDGSKSDYGFGWMIIPKGMWHNGSWLGARTMIARNTENNSLTVILDNGSTFHIDSILKELGKLN